MINVRIVSAVAEVHAIYTENGKKNKRECKQNHGTGGMTMQKSNPCKGCPDRDAGCHGRCELYLSWQAEHAKMKQAMWKHKQADSMANAYAKETHARLRKARKSRYDD